MGKYIINSVIMYTEPAAWAYMALIFKSDKKWTNSEQSQENSTREGFWYNAFKVLNIWIPIEFTEKIVPKSKA